MGVHIAIYKKVASLAKGEPKKMPIPDAMPLVWWLNSNPDIWGGWVTEEAAEQPFSAALAAGETADGWPEELDTRKGKPG